MTSKLPGEAIASISTHLAGAGTHVRDSSICASIVGQVSTTPASSKNSKATIKVEKLSSGPSLQKFKLKTLPKLNNTVVCRITRVQSRQASASILLVDDAPSDLVPESLTHLTTTTASSEDVHFSAVLRREDVRLTEKDKVVMNDSFRVGDIVRATVIGLGDGKNYYISTGGNDFGVVIAKSEDGNAMIPASWKEMTDAITRKVELRKVAKPS
jgi:exosome complex component CSL4